MFFNHQKILSACAIVLFASCSDAANKASESPVQAKAQIPSVGTTPTVYASSFQSMGIDKNTVYITNNETMQLQKISLEPLAMVAAINLPIRAVDQSILYNDEHDYFVTIADSRYAIVRADGGSSIDPAPMLGNIKTVAFATKASRLAMSDDTGAIALLRLSDTGEVQGSWVGGPIIGGQVAGAGAMTSNGLLTFISSGGKVLVVDVDASINARAWKFEAKTIDGFAEARWVAAIPGVDDRLLALTDKQVVVIDVRAGTIVDTYDIGEQRVVGSYFSKTPHIITAPSKLVGSGLTPVAVTYFGDDGQLQTFNGAVGETNVGMSVLDIANDRLTYRFGSSILRHRLSDSLQTASIKAVNKAEMALADDYVLYHYQSAFGLIRRRSYGKVDDTQEIRMFNFESVLKSQR